MKQLASRAFANCFMLVSCLVHSLTLKMGATCSSKTSVGFQQTACHYIQQNRTLYIRHYFNPFWLIPAVWFWRLQMFVYLQLNQQLCEVANFSWWWIMNYEGCGRKQSLLDLRYCPCICLEKLKRPWKTCHETWASQLSYSLSHAITKLCHLKTIIPRTGPSTILVSNSYTVCFS
jgi:hypothetical protein